MVQLILLPLLIRENDSCVRYSKDGIQPLLIYDSYLLQLNFKHNAPT